MKIFISQTIEKEIFKIFRSKKAQEIFVEKLKKINPELIYIKRPIVKIKTSLFSATFRIVGDYSKKDDVLIILFVLKKTDKAFGENIFWDKKLQDLISFRNEKISNDIEEGNFKLYS